MVSYLYNHFLFISLCEEKLCFAGFGFYVGEKGMCLFFMAKGGGVMKNILIYQWDIILMSEALMLLAKILLI